MIDVFHLFWSLPLLSRVLLEILFVLFAAFVMLFLVRGALLFFTLLNTQRRMRDVDGVDLEALSRFFAANRTLRHLWSEYRETLHLQTTVDPTTGVEKINAVRSTIPAEALFNTATLIEGRLFTEFFKHLPGVFTGIGIIGTFMGLIAGLRAFQISEEPSVVRESLNLLLHGVHEAFLVSAGAISLAMIVTVLEKFLLAALHRQVEGLSQRLDSLFEAGAGEEYLARLVRATEESSSQTRVLKDALVRDLKDILSELTDRQITAAKSGNVELADRITSSLESGLKAPLDEVAKAVTAVGQQRGEAVNELLTNVLVSFSQRLEHLFGGQIAGINQLQQKTVESLEAAVVGLERMVANIENASRNSCDALTDKLGEAIGAMELRQRAMNEQMGGFVEQIHALVGQSQSETGEKLQTMLGALGERFETIVGALQKRADDAAGAHAERESRIATQTQDVIAGLGGQVDALLVQLTEAMASMRTSIDSMSSATADAVNRMKSGAETLLDACSDFARARQSVSGVLDKTTAVSAQLAQSAASVSATTRSLEGMLSEQQAAREAIAQLVSTLDASVANARKEAALTSDVLQRIEGATTKLVEAQHAADQYLEGITGVLGAAHDTFALNVQRTLGTASTEFMTHLTQATGRLREAIQELEVALEPGARQAA